MVATPSWPIKLPTTLESPFIPTRILVSVAKRPATRNNAQQIRGAFCESANNQPDPYFSVFFVRSAIICAGETITFTSTIVPGSCPDPFGTFPSATCAVDPYQHEWRLSTDPTFASSQIGRFTSGAKSRYRCTYSGRNRSRPGHECPVLQHTREQPSVVFLQNGWLGTDRYPDRNIFTRPIFLPGRHCAGIYFT